MDDPGGDKRHHARERDGREALDRGGPLVDRRPCRAHAPARARLDRERHGLDALRAINVVSVEGRRVPVVRGRGAGECRAGAPFQEKHAEQGEAAEPECHRAEVHRVEHDAEGGDAAAAAVAGQRHSAERQLPQEHASQLGVPAEPSPELQEQREGEQHEHETGRDHVEGAACR